MIVRRIREHVASHNWFAVVVDLMIVIIGVFIGLQVSNWNAARIERGEVRAYRVQIIDNLKANELEIAARARYYRQVRGHALATLKALESNAPRGEQFLIDAYQASQYWAAGIERSAYDELIASGMAKSFGDPPSRRRLSSYYAMTDQFEATAARTTAYREQLRRAMKFAVQQRIRENCNDIYTIRQDGLQLAILPEQCSLQLPSALISQAAEQLIKTPELEQDLTRHIGDLDQKIALFDRRVRLARDLRQYLEKLELN